MEMFSSLYTCNLTTARLSLDWMMKKKEEERDRALAKARNESGSPSFLEPGTRSNKLGLTSWRKKEGKNSKSQQNEVRKQQASTARREETGEKKNFQTPDRPKNALKIEKKRYVCAQCSSFFSRSNVQVRIGCVYVSIRHPVCELEPPTQIECVILAQASRKQPLTAVCKEIPISLRGQMTEEVETANRWWVGLDKGSKDIHTCTSFERQMYFGGGTTATYRHE